MALKVTFRIKMILGILITSFLITLSMLYVGLGGIRAAEQEFVIDQARLIARQISQQVAQGIKAGNFPLVKERAYGFVTDPNVHFIRIQDAKGNVIAEVGNRAALRKYMPDPEGGLELDAGMLHYQQDIEQGYEMLGSVSFGLIYVNSPGFFENLLMLGAGILLPVFGVLAVFSYLLGTILTERLHRLSRAAEQIASEGPGVMVDVSGSDEIASVSKAFNDMSARLIESYREMHDSAERYREMAHLLTEQKTMQSAMLSGSLDAVVIIDSQGFIREFNEAAERIFGYERDYVLNKRMAELIVPEHFREAHHAGMKRYLAGSPSRILNQRLELEAINSQGEIFPIELTIAEIKLEQQKFFSAFIRDLTVQREAELELKMAAHAFETQEAIFITDERSKIMRVNAAFERLTGYSAQEAYGMSSAELIVPGLPEREQGQSWHDGLDAKPYASESRVKPKFAAAFPVRLIISEILDDKGDVTHRVAHFSDITEQREYEEKLTKARQDAEYANRAKTRFLASMSHEIRTPLNAVINLNSLLLKTPLDGDQSRLARAANEGGKTLLNLIEGILDLAEIEAGKMSIQQKQFDLHELLQEIVRLFEQQAMDKNLRLELKLGEEVPHWIEGDPDRMRQILVNLVGNSIKFTEEGYIEIDVSINPEKSTVFSVIDTGPGIDTEASQFLFDEFFQVDSGYARRHAGSGLGLTISKRLATMMHGNIEWAAREEGGSVFTLVLPLISVPVVGESPKIVDDETRFSGHVLVVEDQEHNRLVMDELLSRLGLDVSMAENGQQAIDMVKSDESLNMVFMDVSMPVLDGIEATKKIRKLPGACKDTIIVAMTANAFAEDRDRCLAAGMNDFLAKPIDSMRLSKCIAHWLGNTNAVAHQVASDSPDDSRVSLGELHDERVTDRLRADLSSEAFPRVVRAFVDGLPGRINELVEALSEKDPEVIANAAHALKSSAATFGAIELAVRARQVENEARAGKVAGLDRAVERIRPVLKQTVTLYVSRFLGDGEGVAKR